MAVASPERVRQDLLGLVQRGLGVREFALRAPQVLASAVPFDGVCVLTMDPTTQVPTGEVVENGLPGTAMARMAEIELSGADVNTFAALARAEQHAAGLSAATEGDLDRSRRHRELRRPHGLGDELRATLVSDHTVWGALTLLRGRDRPDFAPSDTALVGAVTDVLADGLRRATLRDACAAARTERGVGLIVLAADGALVAVDPVAERWLVQLRGEGGAVPVAVTAVACRARRIAAGQAAAGGAARARVRTADGQWLVLYAATSTGPDATTTVVVEPASSHEIAPLVATAYGLTARERAVIRLVARGLATKEIGAELHLSPWTVQDHLKAVFGKVGVGSRGELVARLFFPTGPPELTG
jgi:DNA-binding CsgD family transcriptional regulator